MRSYQQCLDFLYSQLPMYQRVGPAALKKDLKNIKKLCYKLGNPEALFPSVHVAGTNGKGSVTHMMAAALAHTKLRVGIYTSPHYLDFRERIKVNNKLISKRAVTQFVRENMDSILELKPSFFEITVAMAFHHFAKEKIDIAIIETGLGGRLDSTNVINPLLSVITNISLDHQQMLGNTLKEIAGEKAGIIKSNVPVIIGEKQKEVQSVFTKKASSKKAILTYASSTLSKKERELLKELLRAPYQEKNVITALASLKILGKSFNDYVFSKSDAIKSFTQLRKKVYYLGRWQTLSKKPLVITDSAHNLAGLTEVLKALKKADYPHIHFVLGFVNDKKLDSVLTLFPKDASYYFAKANIPRGLNAHELHQQAVNLGLNGKAYSSVRKALAIAKRKVKRGELIYVGGSIFTAAEVM